MPENFSFVIKTSAGQDRTLSRIRRGCSRRVRMSLTCCTDERVPLSATRRQFLSTASAALAWASLRNRAFAIQASGAPAESLAQKLARDPLRPQFHLLPAANWMNDPNGPVFWKGKYHLFFQYNPNGAYWGDMHWAHAVSTDLVHWKHLPVALAPTPGGYDSEGCFSGSTVIDHGTPTIIYTGVKMLLRTRPRWSTASTHFARRSASRPRTMLSCGLGRSCRNPSSPHRRRA